MPGEHHPKIWSYARLHAWTRFSSEQLASGSTIFLRTNIGKVSAPPSSVMTRITIPFAKHFSQRTWKKLQLLQCSSRNLRSNDSQSGGAVKVPETRPSPDVFETWDEVSNIKQNVALDSVNLILASSLFCKRKPRLLYLY